MAGHNLGRRGQRSVIALASIVGGAVGFLLGTLVGVYTGGCYQDGWWKSSCTSRLMGLAFLGITVGAAVFGVASSKILQRRARGRAGSVS